MIRFWVCGPPASRHGPQECQGLPALHHATRSRNRGGNCVFEVPVGFGDMAQTCDPTFKKLKLCLIVDMLNYVYQKH